MKLIIIAPMGHMGKTISRIAAGREDVTVVGAVGPKGRPYIGWDLGLAACVGRELGIRITDDLEAIIAACDCIVDFSTPETGIEVLRLARKYKKALVTGTTGFSEKEMQNFRDAGKEIPMLYAANTSRMVGTMNHALKQIAEELGDRADVEIIEMHANTKRDAPSGTSLEIGEMLAEVMGKDLREIATFGREGSSPREKGTIGYHSVRAGNIVSSHTVIFGGLGERIEITHHAYDNDCFGNGAVDCAVFAAKQAPGFYGVSDCFRE